MTRTGVRTAVVEVGRPVMFEGQPWMVTRLGDGNVTLARPGRQICALMSDVQAAVADAAYDPPAATGLDLDTDEDDAFWGHATFAYWSPESLRTVQSIYGLTEEVVDEADRRARLISKFLSGYEYGYPTRHGEEPCPILGPGALDETGVPLGKTARLARLAAEIGLSVQKTRPWVTAFANGTVADLIDGRHKKLPSIMRSCPKVLEVQIRDIVEEYLGNNASRLPINLIVDRVTLRMEKVDPAFSMPSTSTMYDYINIAAAGYLTHLATKTTQGNSTRPKPSNKRRRAVCPFDIVQIDATPFDLMVLDPKTGLPYRPRLLLAVDVFSRSIVAFRFKPHAEASLDMNLLLHQMITPQPALKEWAGLGAWIYGIPASLAFTNDTLESLDVAGMPAGTPRTVGVDRAKVNMSESFLRACSLLDIDIDYARPRTGSDKAVIERLFRRISQQFCTWFTSYTGPRLDKRGIAAKVEGEAVYFLHEIETLFREWVAVIYQNSEHRGLAVPGVHLPEPMTPNKAYDMGIAAMGAVPVVADRALLVSLLEGGLRPVHHYGIEIEGLRFNSHLLYPYRNMPSAFGKSSDKDHASWVWPVRYDPRNLTHVYFLATDPDNPSRGRWLKVPAVGMDTAVPFGATLLAYLKELILTDTGERFPTVAQIEAYRRRMLDRVSSEGPANDREKRILAADRALAELAARDLAILDGLDEADADHGVDVDDEVAEAGMGTNPHRNYYTNMFSDEDDRDIADILTEAVTA